MDQKVLIENTDGFECFLLRFFDVFLVVRVEANEGSEPASKCREHLLVGIRHPSDDRSIILFRLSEETSLLILGGYYASSVIV